MQRLSSCLIAVAAVAAALPAFAQQPPPPSRPSLPPPPPQSRMLIDRPYQGMMPAMRAEYESFLDSMSGNNIGPQPLARVDLANRVSTLIELGRCTDARNEAREAGDRLMALKARQMCGADRPAG